MAFHWLFPTPVLQVDLTPEAGVAAAMDAELVTFDRELFAHPEFSDRNNLIRLDITNADSKSEFIDAIRKLNYQISRDDLPYVGKTKKKATSTSTNSDPQQP